MIKKLKEKIYNNYSRTLFEKYKDYNWKFDPISGTFFKEEFKVSCRPSAEYYNSLVFRPSLSVKNKVIADILNQIFPDTAIYNVVGRGQSQELAQMVGVEWQSPYLSGQDNYHYDIYEDTDISPIVADHWSYMEKVGFPFFDNFSSLEKIDAFINDRILELSIKDFQESLKIQEKEKILLNFYRATGAYYGLVSAFLIQRNNIKDLTKRFILLYSKYPVLERLEKLIIHLEANYN